MTASFPWYDLPSVRWANDVLWRATGLPGNLDRTNPPLLQWGREDLIISQACGLDLFLSDAPIEPVLTPIFDLDCEPGHYYSYLVTSNRARSRGGSVAAVNSLTSRSGYSALRAMREPESLYLTGSHRESVRAVLAGMAQYACIDAVTWHILERDTPRAVAGMTILERTSTAPAPPFVVRKDGRRDAVDRLVMAMNDSATALARSALMLRGVIPANREHYLSIWSEYQALPEAVLDISRPTPG